MIKIGSGYYAGFSLGGSHNNVVGATGLLLSAENNIY